MSNEPINSLSIFFYFFILSSYYPNTAQAAVVINTYKTSSPKLKRAKNRIKKGSKSVLKKRLNKLKKRQDSSSKNAGEILLMVVGIAWYPISIALLIVALVFGITPLLVTAIVLLCLPVLIFLILGLILIIGFATAGDLC